jgi:recombinational DNA repair protein (RecF pathway)
VNTGAFDPFSEICDRASQAAGLLRAAGFRVLNEVGFSQVLVACATPEQTLATMTRLQRSGEAWCGGLHRRAWGMHLLIFRITSATA